MKIKLEKINELESLGFRKMRPYNGEVNYCYDFNSNAYGEYKASIRVNEKTGDITIKILKQNTFALVLPDIIKTLISNDFIE